MRFFLMVRDDKANSCKQYDNSSMILDTRMLEGTVANNSDIPGKLCNVCPLPLTDHK